MSEAMASSLAKHPGQPVGVFDSGIGGLSVLQHIQQLLPQEELLYFADSGFAPYGDKADQVILERSLKIVEFLLQQGIKALVIACNTATAAAASQIRLRYPDLIVVGMEPGLKPAALQSADKVVGVLATNSTLQSQKFRLLRDKLATETGARFFAEACIGLVDQIEQGQLETGATLQLVRRYVAPLLAQGADTLVLGCTHYPFIAPLIEQVIQETSVKPVQLIDTGVAVARQLQRLLEQAALLAPQLAAAPKPLIVWSSGDTGSLEHALQQMLNLSPDQYTIKLMT